MARQIEADIDADLTDRTPTPGPNRPTGPRQRALRVSAAARRAAAAYGDGAQRLAMARTHGCLLLLARERLGPGGIYVEFCVRHNGTLSPAVPTC